MPGRILLSDGDFNIAASIDLGSKHGMILEGQGMTTSYLRAVAGLNSHVIKVGASATYCSGSKIAHLGISSNVLQTAGSGIYGISTEYLVIEGIMVGGCKEHGIHLTAGGGQNSNYPRIIGCAISTNNQHGIYIVEQVYSATITGANVISGNGKVVDGAGIHCENNDSHTIVGNLFDDNLHAISIYNCSYGAITGNTFENHQRFMILMQTGSHHYAIGSNHMLNPGQAAADTYSAIRTDGDYNVIVGNSIWGLDNRLNAGIEEQAGADYNLIEGNNIQNTIAGQGVILVGAHSVARGNIGYNPVGAKGPPAVPATTVAYTNAYGVDCTVHITGGTVTVIAVGGTTTGLTSGSFRVPAGQTITITYSSVPTWTWFGD